MQTHRNKNQSQFDSQAQAYLQSKVHAAGPDLIQAQHIVRQLPGSADKVLLDIGCGAGHLSFALAPLVRRVYALDPLAGMLQTVREAAISRRLQNIDVQRAEAEQLPFTDQSVDIVATRYSAHHWEHLPIALKEMHRVLKSGGHVLIIDLQGDENPLVDTHLQTLELLRDPSHIRDRAPSEWVRLLAHAGFPDLTHETWPTRLEFEPWVTRMRTPPARIATIRDIQREAPQEVRMALELESDGSFTARTGLWWGIKP